jgi:2-(3-amino-3-carboxypropyl)histidine synthase
MTVPTPSPSYPTIGEPLFAELRRHGYRRLALQVPAGLLRSADETAARISEATGARVAVLVRACFGACDLPTASEIGGAEAAIVLGHAEIPNVVAPVPTYFVEMRQPGGDPERLAQVVVEAGLPSRLGLVASIQHLDLVDPLVDSLARRGVTVRIGSGDRRLQYAAQALGCNYTTAQSVEEDVEGFLFLGTGRFHPLGLAYAVTKPVWALDPLQAILEPPLDRARMVAHRQMLVAQASSAQRWGILVSTFAGQSRRGMAESLVRRAEAHGRSASLVLGDRFDPRDLMGRGWEAFVCTACPRIALDDSEMYPAPVLTPPEFLMAIGERPLHQYQFDTFH